VDKDHSGKIELDEFKRMFDDMKIENTAFEVKQIFNSIDIDFSGTVEFHEFKLDFDVNFQSLTIVLPNP